MEQVFADLGRAGKGVFLFLIAFIVINCFVAFNDDPLQRQWHLTIAVVAWLSLLGFLGPNIWKAAQLGDKHVLSVCIWTVVLMAGFVVYFYYWYFNWVPASDTPIHDRALNIVPVLVASVIASLGWYVHYQFSAKAHRTNNAFSMVMEMRKSSEFLKRHELFSKHFPSGVPTIPTDYQQYFPSTALRDMEAEARARDEKPEAFELEKLEAILALKYLLNYYEFMAAGVMANDLDANLLLETVSELVVRCYQKAEPLVKYVQGPVDKGGLGQTEAYENLGKLVEQFAAMDIEKATQLRKAKARGKK